MEDTSDSAPMDIANVLGPGPADSMLVPGPVDNWLGPGLVDEELGPDSAFELTPNRLMSGNGDSAPAIVSAITPSTLFWTTSSRA